MGICCLYEMAEQTIHKERTKCGWRSVVARQKRRIEEISIARITQGFRGSDQIIRSVELRCPTKSSKDKYTAHTLNVRKPTLIRRWVGKIGWLEAIPSAVSESQDEEHHENIATDCNDSSNGDDIGFHCLYRYSN